MFNTTTTNNDTFASNITDGKKMEKRKKERTHKQWACVPERKSSWEPCTYDFDYIISFL